MTPPKTTPEAELHVALLRAAAELQAPFSQLFKQHGLSDAQYNVLRILRGAGPEGLACQGIAERLIQRVPDVTRLVDRLEDARLVERSRPDADRRVVLVRITRSGLARLAELDGPVLALHRRGLAGLSRTEIATLTRLLAKAGART